jgi:threonine dehydrogenase-like Zn-dependent dehydrogenase
MGRPDEGVMMRATLMYGAGDVRVETVPDAKLQEPTDALVRVTQACICGSDLWPYDSMPRTLEGRRMGHEFIGVIEDLGRDVSGFTRGDVVVAPFVWADNTCDFCVEGLQTSCRHGGGWGAPGVDAGQGEAVRVPQAQGTLVKLPVGEDSELMPSLLTLSDVFCTGHHCAVTAGVTPRTTVTVIGDGAVGLSAVLAAKRLGAERIILMGRHQPRTDLGRYFGATDVVAERAATRGSNASGNSPVVTVPTRCSNASARYLRSRRRPASFATAEPSAESVSRSTPTCRSGPSRSCATSPSPVALHRLAPTSMS